LILGCTHYPALREAIARVTGASVKLVDSAQAIAEIIQTDIARGLLKGGSGEQKLRVMATDVSSSFAEVAARLMNPINLPNLEQVDIGTV
jgi:glutamate racemase